MSSAQIRISFRRTGDDRLLGLNAVMINVRPSLSLMDDPGRGEGGGGLY